MLINSQRADSISIIDRGLLYGDGVFETILCEAGRPVLLAGHTQRLENGCKRLNLPVQDLPTILSDVRQVAGDDDCIVKVIVTRGAGARGYKYDREANNSTRIVYRDEISVIPEDYYTRGVSLTLCEHRLASNAPLAEIKHLNRLDQVLARSEWDGEFQEGIMLNATGNVIEGTMSNIFIEANQKWITPKLDNVGVAGVMRQWIMRNSYYAEMECVEEEINISDIENAEAVFVCNSVIGIWPVTAFAGKEYTISAPTKKIMDYMRDNLSKYYMA